MNPEKNTKLQEALSKVMESRKGGRIMAFVNSPKGCAAMLRVRDMRMMRMDQPKCPRSKNRETDHHKAIRDGLWAATYPELKDEAIDPHITNALQSGNLPEVLEAIAEGATMAKSPPPLSGFARHVITALSVAIHIMENENIIPTKERVRTETKAVFEVKKWSGFQDEITRWTEFFKAAGLSSILPNEKKPHSPAKHGDRYTEGRKKTKASPSVWCDEAQGNEKKG